MLTSIVGVCPLPALSIWGVRSLLIPAVRRPPPSWWDQAIFKHFLAGVLYIYIFDLEQIVRIFSCNVINVSHCFLKQCSTLTFYARIQNIALKMDRDSREIPLGLFSACSMNTFVTLQEPTIVMYYHQVLVEFPPGCQSFSENRFHRHFFPLNFH